MKSKEKYYCSFCGKHHDDVDKMIVRDKRSGSPCICNECVLDCVAVLLKPKDKKEAKDATIQPN